MNFKGQLKTKDTKLKYQIYAIENSRDLCKAALKKLREMVDTTALSNDETARNTKQRLTPTVESYSVALLEKEI